jgi:hypothetical protein
MLLLIASFMTATSARIIHDVFHEMYGTATLPELTMFYLGARAWALAVPFAFAILGAFVWKRKGDVGLQYVSVVAHLVTVGMMFMVVFGIVFPFLTTTFGLSR